MSNKRALGKWVENAVAHCLEEEGYDILKRNYYSPYGEIDIIAQDGECTVFIEVRSKSNTVFGLPQETISHKKRKRLKRTALCYLRDTASMDILCRFDVIAVELNNSREIISYNIIKNAI